MASKAEKLREQYGANITESTSTGRAGGARPPSAMPARKVVARDVGTERDRTALVVALDQLVPDPDQPRKHFDPESIQRLARSLKRRGQLQPIKARFSETLGKWVVISGERRYRSAMMAGLPSLLVSEYNKTDGIETLRDQVIENMVREDLDPIEEARVFEKLMAEEGVGQRELAESLEVPQARIAQRLALLKLPESVQESVTLGELPASSAYLVSQAPEGRREEIAARAVEQDLTRAEIKDVVDRAVAEAPDDPARPKKAKKAGQGGTAKKKPGFVAERKFRTESKIVLVATRKAPFDTAALLGALRQAVAQVEAEAGEPVGASA